MQRLRRLHRHAAWIAILAVSLSALVPTLSRAMSASSDVPVWMEICTMAGMVSILADPSGGNAPVQESPPLGEPACPYCCPHAGSFGLAPVDAAFIAPRLAPRRQVPSSLFAPAVSLRWGIASPRAPPALF